MANILYYFAVGKIGPSRVAVYTNLAPGFTLMLAYFMLGEHVTALQLCGLAVIMGGIAVSKSGGTKPSTANE